MIRYEHSRSGKGDYIFFRRTLNLNFHPHLHTSFEYLAVERGALTLVMGKHRFRLEAGDKALILPGQVHAYECGEALTFARLCIFSADWMPDFAGKCREELPRLPILPRGDFPGVTTLQAAEQEHYLLKARLYELAAAYLRSPVWEDAPARENGFAADFLDYLEAHYTESLTLRDAAAALGYNYHYISGLVRRCFGSTFPQLLSEYRVARACELLRESRASITEICHACGYDSMRSFNRNFRLLTGTTPSGYRGG